VTDTVPPWPWLGDSELEKRERIARDYRNALHAIDPHYCSELDRAYQRLGHRWINPQVAILDLEAHVPAGQLAELIGVKIDVIYQWAHRGHITKYRNDRAETVYLVGEAVDYHAELRKNRIAREKKRASGRKRI
jgi:hypothetical protein